MTRSLFHLCLCLSMISGPLLACDGRDISDKNSGLDDFLPELPPTTGEAQSTFAGVIGEDNEEERIPGPSSTGIVGDYFMRNNKARFVIQAPTLLTGVVPSGGNLIDAVPLGADGGDLSPDQYGETSVIYQLGRNCNHDSMEVVRDGSDGGAAVLRARGFTSHNEMVNIRGIGLLPIQNDLVPELPDFAECATTYVLEPDSATVQIYFTLYNPTEKVITGPLGLLSDTGGEVFVFLPGSGFGRIGSIEGALNNLGASAPYMVWQGPDVAYGIMPRHEDLSTPNASLVILGISIFVFGVDTFTGVLESSSNKFFRVESQQGFTFEVDVFAGRDAADVEREFQRLTKGETVAISGTASWSDGEGAEDARIGIFEDVNGDDEVDDDDRIVSFIDSNPDGSFSGAVPAGDYLLRAEVAGLSRSAAVSVSTKSGPATASLSLDRPVVYDYRIVDDGDGDAIIPGRITVIGDHPIAPDLRTHGQFDSYPGIVTTLISKRGTSTDLGDGADAQLILPAGSDYRIFVSRGTEWSIAEQVVSPKAGDTPDELEFRMRRVIDTSNYISSEYHVHSLGSPDSPIPDDRRVATAVADGIEFYATTDHDFVTEQQPIIEMLGLDRLTRSIPGLEISPLVYGHVNAWPIEPDNTQPNHGAVDWPFGIGGFAMTPGEIYESAREKGAECIQVNHPRSGPSPSDITEQFDRLGLEFDYENRSFQGDVNRMPVPPDWLRLPPEMSNLFSDAFNVLEVWNGFDYVDSNVDGVRENGKLDIVMRDWFNFMSFGKNVTPIGSSDTHYEVLESMGMPRTLVRVSDDSADAIFSGTNLIREILDNLTHSNDVLTDVVVTDGPFIRMSVAGDDQPLGKVHDGSSGSIEVTVQVQTPDFAQVDTIELFANATPEVGKIDFTVLQPFACFTSRTDMMDNDPCVLAGKGGAGTLTLTEVDVGNGFKRSEASITLTVSASDIPARAGATGTDAWIVARARGQRPIYPLFIGTIVTPDNVATFIEGIPAQVEAALVGKGRIAEAFTSAFFVDFDGGGYRAPFAP